MAELKITLDEKIKIEAKDLDPIQVFSLLREIISSNLEIASTTNYDEPVSVNFPTSSTNLLEVDEVFEPTPYMSKGTKVRCAVDCPECQDHYERQATVGYPVACRSCNSMLFSEPHFNGLFRANKLFGQRGEESRQ